MACKAETCAFTPLNPLAPGHALLVPTRHFEDVFRRSKTRVKLESEALDDKYEIFSSKDQDANWLRQLFAPTFIVWLTDSAPSKFAFELVDGNLCCYVHGHMKKAAELDTIRTASAAVATRLRDETLE